MQFSIFHEQFCCLSVFCNFTEWTLLSCYCTDDVTFPNLVATCYAKNTGWRSLDSKHHHHDVLFSKNLSWSTVSLDAVKGLGDGGNHMLAEYSANSSDVGIVAFADVSPRVHDFVVAIPAFECPCCR